MRTSYVSDTQCITIEKKKPEYPTATDIGRRPLTIQNY